MRSKIFALVFLAAWLIGGNPLAAQLTPVKIGHNAFTDETVFYLGRDVGIFKKHGIHLELIYIPGGSLSVQALIGNSLDMLLAGGTPLVYAVLKGADLVSHREEAIKKSMQLLKIDDRQAAEVGYDYRLKTLPADGKLSVKGMQLVIDAAAEDDPKAKSLTPQQLFDLSFLP